MNILIDGAGNEYVNVGNIRITYLLQCPHYPGSPGLRIQAYKDGTPNSLHMGAEIPILNHGTALKLVEAIALLAGDRK